MCQPPNRLIHHKLHAQACFFNIIPNNKNCQVDVQNMTNHSAGFLAADAQILRKFSENPNGMKVIRPMHGLAKRCRGESSREHAKIEQLLQGILF